MTEPSPRCEVGDGGRVSTSPLDPPMVQFAVLAAALTAAVVTRSPVVLLLTFGIAGGVSLSGAV